MDRDEVLAEFRAAGALLEGHFVLSSGRHSAAYLQCARVLMDARRAERLCRALAKKVREAVDREIAMVFSPAMGGVVVGYEMGRQLGVPSIFFERVDGEFELRRGFEIEQGTPCLMVEDVVTTGLSSRECIAAARQAGADVVAGCCLVDRSGSEADIGVPLISLASLEIPTYAADELPVELKDVPAVKPGSRTLR
ncbi:MAG: orotate phosphoribosyltransferase [Alphaproteobacteria bacterium]|nr:MAG: orotate phosphoribosyltransferase [Alphaproteobacteria bacterium]